MFPKGLILESASPKVDRRRRCFRDPVFFSMVADWTTDGVASVVVDVVVVKDMVMMMMMGCLI